MPVLKEMEIGLMFWGDRNPRATIRAVKALGFPCGQLGIAGHVAIPEVRDDWKDAITIEDFSVTTVFAAFEGESYADIPTVQKTVGFIPEATREVREKRSCEVIEFAAFLGVPSFACHVGFIPEDPNDPVHEAVRALVARLCSVAGARGMTVALETGQERAEHLRDFIEAVGASNLKINFDPANMVLYGTQEPIQALELLAPWLISVHVKDGLWPPKDRPDALGTEMPLGEGAVGIDRFVAKLKQIGYRGPLTIEREVSLDQDMDDRHKEGISHQQDIRNAIQLLERLRG